MCPLGATEGFGLGWDKICVFLEMTPCLPCGESGPDKIPLQTGWRQEAKEKPGQRVFLEPGGLAAVLVGECVVGDWRCHLLRCR